MKGLILAGGQGTRLRPLTTYTPKPVVPLVNRPFALYQIELLRKAGITDITFSLNYQPEKIEEALGDGSEYGVRLRYVCEPHPMGTGGAFRYAMNGCDETTIVLNGDILTDLQLKELIAFHRQNDAAATLGLVRVEDPSRYGVAKLDEHNRINGFLEKPKGAATPNTINAGLYILEPSVLNSIPFGENYSFEYQVFPSLLENKARFYGFVLENAYWRDIGTLESYLAAHMDFLAGRIAPFDLNSSNGTDLHLGVDDLSVIGENCSLESGAQILNSVIGADVEVADDVVVQNSVIWSNTRIASQADIRDAVIGRACLIGRNAILRNGAAIGDYSTV
jgi:NDP-sugar pyrophosphorylase family protein